MRLLTAVVAAAFIFAIPANAAPTAQTGIGIWDHLYWGITHQRTAAAYPNFETWTQSDLRPFDARVFVDREHYGIKSHFADGCFFMVSLEFTENRLDQLIMDQDLSGKFVDCHAQVMADLASKYGSRPKVTDNGSMVSYEWDTTKSTIVLTETNLQNGNFSVAVIYTDRAWIEKLTKPSRNSHSF